MVYRIIHGRVVFGRTGKAYITQGREVAKFENEHHFNFDITNPENWRKFLRRFRTSNGKLLPRKTRDGDPVAYYVHMIGIPKYMLDSLPDREHNSYYCCFPGEKIRRAKKEGEFLVPKYGRID